MLKILQTYNDIILKTNHDTNNLEFRDIENSGTDYLCNLVVKSQGFEARCRFEFNDEFLEKFLIDLKHMDEKFEGKAILRAYFGDNHITLEIHNTGSVEVSGFLEIFGECDQSINFCFLTDQTVLKSLTEDFYRYLKFG